MTRRARRVDQSLDGGRPGEVCEGYESTMRSIDPGEPGRCRCPAPVTTRIPLAANWLARCGVASRIVGSARARQRRQMTTGPPQDPVVRRGLVRRSSTNAPVPRHVRTTAAMEQPNPADYIDCCAAGSAHEAEGSRPPAGHRGAESGHPQAARRDRAQGSARHRTLDRAANRRLHWAAAGRRCRTDQSRGLARRLHRAVDRVGRAPSSPLPACWLGAGERKGWRSIPPAVDPGGLTPSRADGLACLGRPRPDRRESPARCSSSTPAAPTCHRIGR
jgi:hypothetical protein